MIGLSARVGDRKVTVHLRHEKETRSFELNAPVSIELTAIAKRPAPPKR